MHLSKYCCMPCSNYYFQEGFYKNDHQLYMYELCTISLSLLCLIECHMSQSISKLLFLAKDSVLVIYTPGQNVNMKLITMRIVEAFWTYVYIFWIKGRTYTLVMIDENKKKKGVNFSFIA